MGFLISFSKYCLVIFLVVSLSFSTYVPYNFVIDIAKAESGDFIDSGLVSQLKLNEGSGISVGDSQGALSGLAQGAPLWDFPPNAIDGNNSSLSFNTVQRVDFGAATVFDGLTAGNISAWVNLDTYQSGSNTWDVIISKDEAIELLVAGDDVPGRDVEGDGGIMVRINNDRRFSLPGLLSRNTWHHISVNYDFSGGLGSGSDYIELFVDGVAYAMNNADGNNGSRNANESYVVGTSINNTTDNIYLGDRSSGFGIDGSIDDVRIYNRSLDRAEVQGIANDVNKSVVISEVEFDPSGNEAESEWFELYNNSSSTVDISGWTIEEDNGTFYTFPASTTIAPGKYLLVANDEVEFQLVYPGISVDLEMDSGGGGLLALNNSGGDKLSLRDGSVGTSNLVDFVAWDNEIPGWGITAGNGESICRIDPTANDTDTQSDWASSCSPNPQNSLTTIGSPGGVDENLDVWLKSDQEVLRDNPGVDDDVFAWGDVVSNLNAAVQSTDSQKPDYVENSINFNPAIRFINGDDELVLNTGPESTDSVIYFVGVAEETDAFNVGLSGVDVTALQGVDDMLLTVNASNTYGTYDSDVDVSGSTYIEGLPDMVRIDNDGGVSQVFGVNGLDSASFNSTVDVPVTHIGNVANGTDQPYGRVAEVIVYDSVSQVPLDRKKIESYLALKYGITLDSVVDDYVNSDGNSIYDLTENTSYQSNIIGIGKDQKLDQRISKSETGVVTLTTDDTIGGIVPNPPAVDFTSSNDAPLRASQDEGDYVVLAANMGDLNSAQTNITGYENKINRQWRVEVTEGTIETSNLAGEVNIQFDIPAITNSDWDLVSSDTPDFATSTTLTKVKDVSPSGVTSDIRLSDGKYYGLLELTPADVTVNVVDNLTSEDGDTALIQFELTTQPSADVTISLSSDNTNEGITPASIVITPANWNVPSANQVLVTGVDDLVSDGAVNYNIVTGNVSSTDLSYNALDGTGVADIAISNQDNDPPGVMINVIDNQTNEFGDQAEIQFELLSEPTSDVTIPLSIDDVTEGDLGAVNQIVIAAADWNVPSANTIMVVGLDDNLADGNVGYNLITGDPTSIDPVYDALDASNVSDVTLQNIDNDVAGVNVIVVEDTTDENGDTATLQFALNTEPNDDVTIDLSSSDLTEGSVPASITILPANWNVPANNEVVVTGLADGIVDADISYSILTGNVSSLDLAYDVLDGSTIVDPTLINLNLDIEANISSSGGNGSGVLAPNPFEEFGNSIEDNLNICIDFDDTKNHWAQIFIQSLACDEIISGKTNDIFSPNLNITRAETVKVALLSAGYEVDYDIENDYIDMDSSHWSYSYVATASDLGIVDGYGDGEFKPDQNITRAEAVKILLRSNKVDLKSNLIIPFFDVSEDDWFYDFVLTLYDSGVVVGYPDGNFLPNTPITRAELSKIAQLLREDRI